jgi:type I restriction enzyme R subunit
VHIATVQGMVQRVLYPRRPTPPVDQYDCIVVDECHRGYLLDREMSDTELTFRDYDDYISKYRRVLDYFDAVKIGLTATPALHTTEIFGRAGLHLQLPRGGDRRLPGGPRAADPDHHRALRGGIHWKAGEEVKVYDTGESRSTLFKAPDESSSRSTASTARSSPRTSTAWSATTWRRSWTRPSRRKTLIFCATDATPTWWCAC